MKQRPSRVLKYLDILSRFLSDDIYGLVELPSESVQAKWKDELPQDVALVQEKLEELLLHILQFFFTDIVRIISSHGNSLLTVAAKVRVIQRLVDQYLSERDFALLAVLFDLLFNCLQFISFQYIVFYCFGLSFLESNAVNDDGILFCISLLYFFFSSGYVVIREFTQLCAEIRDWRGFKSNVLFSFWNWIGWASVALTLSGRVNHHVTHMLYLFCDRSLSIFICHNYHADYRGSVCLFV